MGKKTIAQLETELKALRNLRKAQEAKTNLLTKRDIKRAKLKREIQEEKIKADPRHQRIREIGKTIRKSKTFRKVKKRLLEGPGDFEI